ncbi:hypothetical protein D1BOALGB6SA_301 [Olavius sp. associated proteobacterium Delta 1]|nr:hypothetical protein D1BOALGB6SA_301 [Olavius sp. associated proteobacterium Delta 1]
MQNWVCMIQSDGMLIKKLVAILIRFEYWLRRCSRHIGRLN